MKMDHTNRSVFTEATDPTQAPQTNETPEPPNPSVPSDPSTRTRRKSFLPPEFDKLTEEQIEGINDLLRTKTYQETQEQIQFHTGIYISINKLFRYYQK